MNACKSWSVADPWTLKKKGMVLSHVLLLINQWIQLSSRPQMISRMRVGNSPMMPYMIRIQDKEMFMMRVPSHSLNLWCQAITEPFLLMVKPVVVRLIRWLVWEETLLKEVLFQMLSTIFLAISMIKQTIKRSSWSGVHIWKFITKILEISCPRM